MVIQKFMALFLFCAPIAASYADDLVEVNGSNDQLQLPKTKGEAKKYLVQRAPEELGILPKMEYSFLLGSSAGENKKAIQSIEFNVNADLLRGILWRIQFKMAIM